MSTVFNLAIMICGIIGILKFDMSVILAIVLALISIYCFIINFKKLGDNAADPIKRQKCMSTIVINGIIVSIVLISVSIFIIMKNLKLFIVVSLLIPIVLFILRKFSAKK